MIKKLAKSIRQYKKASILSPIFMVLEVLMEVLIPFLMADLVDIGIDGGNMGYVVKMSTVLFTAALLSLGFGVLSGNFSAIASAGFAGNLRHDIYASVQRFSFSNTDKFSSASLITRLTTDVTNVQNAYQMIIRQAVRAPVMMILALSMSFSVNAQISLIFLAIIPILGVGLFYLYTSVHPTFKRAFKKYDRLNGLVQENLHGIRVVKSYVREETENGKFKVISNDIYADFMKAQKKVVLNAPLMQLCVNACMLLVAWVGAKLIVGGSMSTGELMSVIAYVMQILMSLNLLSLVFVMIMISRASAERIVEVLEEEADLKNPEHPIQMVKDGGIVFKNVNFSYVNDTDKLCLKDVNLTILAGETVGIIGGTGSSKTSLIQLIPRLYEVTTGSVTIGGENVKNYDIPSLRNEVAVVLQKNLLFSGTIKENLRWGNADADDAELRRVCRLAQADGFIQEFPKGYDTYIEQGGTNVSGGQKQRLCIARALLKKPKILILDDSTSAVDTKTDAFIRKAFREEIPNTTKLIIAQRISSVQDADKIVVLDGGSINAVGTHSELLASNRIYQEVYHSQIQGGGDFDAEK